jgi:hypothetical protein
MPDFLAHSRQLKVSKQPSGFLFGKITISIISCPHISHNIIAINSFIF